MLHECCTSLRLRLPTSPFSRCLHHQPTELNVEGNRQLGQFRKCLRHCDPDLSGHVLLASPQLALASAALGQVFQTAKAPACEEHTRGGLSSGGDVLGSCPFERLSKAMVPTALQWSGWSLAAGNTGPLKT